jgi:hypothetical protein
MPAPTISDRESEKKVSTNDVYTAAVIAFDVFCFNGFLDARNEPEPYQFALNEGFSEGTKLQLRLLLAHFCADGGRTGRRIAVKTLQNARSARSHSSLSVQRNGGIFYLRH